MVQISGLRLILSALEKKKRKAKYFLFIEKLQAGSGGQRMYLFFGVYVFYHINTTHKRKSEKKHIIFFLDL
jgi:hypothetical protein